MQLRVTDREREEWRAAADAEDLRLSEWLRLAARRAAKHHSKRPGEEVAGKVAS
jgi:hypothetical protein